VARCQNHQTEREEQEGRGRTRITFHRAMIA
jgi:hypothetical protein